MKEQTYLVTIQSNRYRYTTKYWLFINWYSGSKLMDWWIDKHNENIEAKPPYDGNGILA